MIDWVERAACFKTTFISILEVWIIIHGSVIWWINIVSCAPEIQILSLCFLIYMLVVHSLLKKIFLKVKQDSMWKSILLYSMVVGILNLNLKPFLETEAILHLWSSWTDYQQVSATRYFSWLVLHLKIQVPSCVSWFWRCESFFGKWCRLTPCFTLSAQGSFWS